MTPEEFAAQMRNINRSLDVEGKHGEADDLMCQLLRELGYAEGVVIFEAMDRWYA